MTDEAAPGNGARNGYQQYAVIIQTVTVVAFFVGGFWAAVISPMGTRIDKIESGAISRAEHTEFKASIDGKIAESNAEILRLREAVVPRGEHVEKWNGITQSIANVQRQVDDLGKQVGSSYTLRDKIIELQKQLDDVQGQMRRP